MFETTTHDGVPLQVRVSFWQCVKAGVAFSLGALLLLPVIGGAILLFTGSLGVLSALLGLHR